MGHSVCYVVDVPGPGCNTMPTTDDERGVANASRALAQFPYDCFGHRGWEEAVRVQLGRASEEPHIDGVFLLVAAVHSYIFQHLAVCRSHDAAEGASWSSVTNKME